MIQKLFILGAFLFLGMSADIFAAGELDIGFNGSGKTVFNIESSPIPGSFADVLVIGGGKFLVVGRAQINSNSYYTVTLIRCNSDGSLDTSFGGGGKVITDLGVTAEGNSVAVQTDGKIIVTANAGSFPNRMTAVVRYTPDGILDPTFGTNGIFFTSIMKVARDLTVLADNKILVAGDSDIPNLGRTQITKLNANGSLDTTFGTNGITTSTYFSGSDTDKIVVQNDGKIVISGSNLFNVTSALVHRFNADGSPDSTFGTNGIREIPSPTGSMYPNGLAVQSDGKIVLTGFTDAPPFSNTQIYLTRLNSDGSTDTTFGGGFILHELTNDYDRVFDALLQADGKIVISGQKSSIHGIIARFDTNGALDSGFGTGGIVTVTTSSNIGAIALQGSNITAIGVDIYTGGAFISRIDQSGVNITFRNENFVLGKNDQARDVAVQTDGKIVSVGISEGTSRPAASVARLFPDGTLDDTFGTNGRIILEDGQTQSEANAVEIQPDGKIIFAGTHSENSLYCGSLFVVRLKPDGTLDNTFGTGGKVVINLFPDLVGYDLELQTDGKIVICGSSLRMVGDGIFDYDMLAARLNPNGSPDSGFGNNGVFTFITGSAQAQSHEQARALSILPNGKIILAGTHLLRLNADSTVDTTFSQTPFPLSFTATDIKLQTDGKMILSGTRGADFALARYIGTSLDASFGVDGIATLDFGGSDTANAVFVEPDGDILAGGSTLGGSPSRKNFALARFKPTGMPDASFGTGGKVVTDFGGDAEILGITRQMNGKIVAAGGAKLSLDRDYALARYLPGTSAQFDFDGDAKTDLSVFRPSAGEWWYQKSSGGNAAFQFGAGTDKPVAGDYTGDGKTDIAFWRPATNQWFIMRSEDFSYYAFTFGIADDVLVPADYDGDGRTDAAVFRPSTNVWYIQKSTGSTDIITFGAAGDKPVPADYDGDGKADIAIFRPSGGEWWIRRSSNGSVFATQFGNTSDKPVPGDFTGDGKTDVAFWRPSTGQWFVLRSEDFSYYAFNFGISGDVPVAGDYDGDGKADAGVFRPSNSTWFVQRSNAGTLIQTFGITGDQPIPGIFIP